MLANIHHQERPRLDPFSSVVEASEHPHKAPNHAHWVQPDDQQRLLHTSEWLLATDREGPCRHLRRHHDRAPACGRPDHQDRPAGAYWQHAPTAMWYTMHCRTLLGSGIHTSRQPPTFLSAQQLKLCKLAAWLARCSRATVCTCNMHAVHHVDG